MTAVAVVLWVVVAGLFALEWYAVATHRVAMRVWSKPAASASVLPAALASGLLDHPGGWLAALGLVLGVVGDVCLLTDDRTRFLAGLGAFLVGHLLYVAACVAAGLVSSLWLLPAALVLAACLRWSRPVVPAVACAEGLGAAVPVVAYELVTVAVVGASAATGLPLVAVGGMLFLVSDTVLAVDRFVARVRHGDLLVMVPYLLAQAFIVGGLALR